MESSQDHGFLDQIRLTRSKEWWCLDGAWDDIMRIATEREVQKFKLSSGRQLSKYSTHLVGLIGEIVVAKESGMKFDDRLLLGGDDGHDFSSGGKTVNVKTSCYHDDPHLKVMKREKLPCDFYILVAADVPTKRAKLVGHATLADVTSSTVRSYGYGIVYSLTADKLTPGLPPCMNRIR
jgi:hypothetical protein